MINNDYETILFEVIDDIGLLTINREKKLNALNEKVLKELEICLTQANKSNIKGLILIGSGSKAFIAGADVEAMSKMSPVEAEKFCVLGQEVTNLIENLKFPTIAAVNGFALGGGLEVALSCDFIYASENAVFGLPEVSLGLIPGFGGTQRLAKIIGRNKAKELIYKAAMIKVNDALNNGLVLSISSSREELLQSCIETFNQIKKNSPHAISRAKVSVNKGIDLSNEAGLEIEKEIFSSLFASDDMKEGTQAFLEKRKPQFKSN